MPDLVRYLEIVRLCQICQMLSDRADFVRISRFCQILSDMSDFARFCQILPDRTDFAKQVRFVRCLILSVILNHWFDIARVHVIDLCFELAWRYGQGSIFWPEIPISSPTQKFRKSYFFPVFRGVFCAATCETTGFFKKWL